MLLVSTPYTSGSAVTSRTTNSASNTHSESLSRSCHQCGESRRNGFNLWAEQRASKSARTDCARISKTPQILSRRARTPCSPTASPSAGAPPLLKQVCRRGIALPSPIHPAGGTCENARRDGSMTLCAREKGVGPQTYAICHALDQVDSYLEAATLSEAFRESGNLQV